MGEQTGISWADHTMNPWIGCERVSPACAHCYADTLASGRMGMPGLWGGAETPRHITADSTWKKPLKWERDAERAGVRARVFCASMADVFEDRPELEEPRERLFDLIDQTRSLDWLLLTKRPEFARDWLRAYYERKDNWGRVWTSRDDLAWGCLPNVWVGVSVENQRWTWRADVLREIPCAIRFISAEPLLGSLRTPRDERRSLTDCDCDGKGHTICLACGDDPGTCRCKKPLDLEGIDWLIVGGESGKRGDARPMHPSWALELRDDAVRREIPLHFKQWGSWEPDLFGDPNGRFMLPDGSLLDGFAVDAYGIEGCWRMRYAGVSPKAGGKLLDGREWCEVPNVGVLA